MDKEYTSSHKIGHFSAVCQRSHTVQQVTIWPHDILVVHIACPVKMKVTCDILLNYIVGNVVVDCFRLFTDERGTVHQTFRL